MVSMVKVVNIERKHLPFYKQTPCEQIHGKVIFNLENSATALNRCTSTESEAKTETETVDFRQRKGNQVFSS